MSRITMVLMLIAGMLLLGAGVSGFVSDAELSSARLGSDFDDSRYHSFDDFSLERGEQRTRRQEIGLEVVGGIVLMGAGLFFFTPRRQEARTKGAGTAAVVTPARPQTTTASSAIELRYAANRRRPNGVMEKPRGAT